MVCLAGLWALSPYPSLFAAFAAVLMLRLLLFLCLLLSLFSISVSFTYLLLVYLSPSLYRY